MNAAGSLRLSVLVATTLATFVAAGAPRASTEVPVPDPPARWATDRANFLSPAAQTALDDRLAAYAQQTGDQLLVYIDHTTGGVPIEDWAARAFQRWRVGRKGLDNGVALFIFSDDRRLRIEVGYGLEDRVPDIVASRIINDRMVPLIRAGNHDGAVNAGVDALTAAMGAPPGSQRQPGQGVENAPPQGHLPWWAVILGGIAIVLFIRFAIRHPFIAAMMTTNIGSARRGGGGWGGGGFGGGGGGGGFSGGGGSSGGGGASGSW